MAFCSKCGTQLVDGARFCPGCGAPQAQSPVPQNDPYASYAPRPTYMGDDVAQNKGIAALSYVSALIFVPMFTRKDSPFCQYHVRQGMPLFCASVLWFILLILRNIIKVDRVEEFYGITMKIGEKPSTFLTVLVVLVGLAIVGFAVIGIMNCMQGKKEKLPLLSKIDVLKYFGK